MLGKHKIKTPHFQSPNPKKGNQALVYENYEHKQRVCRFFKKHQKLSPVGFSLNSVSEIRNRILFRSDFVGKRFRHIARSKKRISWVKTRNPNRQTIWDYKLLNVNSKAMSLEDHMGKLEKEKKSRKQNALALEISVPEGSLWQCLYVNYHPKR